MDLFDDNEAARGSADFKVNKEYAARFTHNRRRNELEALRGKYGNIDKLGDGDDDDESETDSEDDETEDEDGEQVTADVDAALLRTLAKIRNQDASIYDSSKRVFEAEHQRVLETVPTSAPNPTKDTKKEKRMTLQDYQRKRVEDLIKTSSDPARALADATTNPSKQLYIDSDEGPRTHVQEQEDLRKQVTAAFHGGDDAAEDDDDEDDFFKPKKVRAEGDEEEEEEGEGGAYRKYLLSAIESENLDGAVRDALKDKSEYEAISASRDGEEGEEEGEGTKKEEKKKEEKGSKKRKRKTKEENDDDFLMNYVLNRGWVDPHSASSGLPPKASSSSRDRATSPSSRAATTAQNQPFGRDWEAEAADLASEDSFDSRAEAFETAYNFRFESIADGSAPANVQSFARPSQLKESVRREDDSRKRKREERRERKEREKEGRRGELERFRELQREEVRERVRRILKEAGADEEDKFAHLDLDADFDPNAHDQAMSTAFDQHYYATGEGTPEGAENYDDEDDEAHEDADGKPIWDDDIDIDDIIGMEEEEETGSKGGKDKKSKKKEKKKLKNKQKALEKERAANGGGGEEDDGGEGEEDGDGDGDGDVRMMNGFASGSRIQLEEVDEEALKGMSKEERKRKAKEMEDQLDELDYEDMIGDMPTRFKYASVPKVNYGLTPVEILMADDKDLNEFMGMKMLQPYRKGKIGPNGQAMQPKRPADLNRRLRELRSKLAAKERRLGGSSIQVEGGGGGGGGASVASGSNSEQVKPKRKGKKERLKLMKAKGEGEEQGEEKVTAEKGEEKVVKETEKGEEKTEKKKKKKDKTEKKKDKTE
ncbi:hypothetical protein A4X09_0g7149 [Tilletia walkeri]|uniref:Kri1-like C-terminal domain-containing protein n=1 Tax=Tilletia walkeri TaxID=117179 RepID=A0A8X7N1B9_9BASI|nr:hypothetical protein A4X09_0g7149 [Tilletia walkeri]